MSVTIGPTPNDSTPSESSNDMAAVTFADPSSRSNVGRPIGITNT